MLSLGLRGGFLSFDGATRVAELAHGARCGLVVQMETGTKEPSCSDQRKAKSFHATAVMAAGTHRAGLAPSPSLHAPSRAAAAAARRPFPVAPILNWICSSRSDREGSSWAMAPANSAPDRLHVCTRTPRRPAELIDIPTLFRKPPSAGPAPFKHPEFGSSGPCPLQPRWLVGARRRRGAARRHRAPGGFIFPPGVPPSTPPRGLRWRTSPERAARGPAPRCWGGRAGLFSRHSSGSRGAGLVPKQGPGLPIAAIFPSAGRMLVHRLGGCVQSSGSCCFSSLTLFWSSSKGKETSVCRKGAWLHPHKSKTPPVRKQLSSGAAARQGGPGSAHHRGGPAPDASAPRTPTPGICSLAAARRGASGAWTSKVPAS